jgi:hypothetical protein
MKRKTADMLWVAALVLAVAAGLSRLYADPGGQPAASTGGMMGGFAISGGSMQGGIGGGGSLTGLCIPGSSLVGSGLMGMSGGVSGLTFSGGMGGGSIQGLPGGSMQGLPDPSPNASLEALDPVNHQGKVKGWCNNLPN